MESVNLENTSLNSQPYSQHSRMSAALMHRRTVRMSLLIDSLSATEPASSPRRRVVLSFILATSIDMNVARYSIPMTHTTDINAWPAVISSGRLRR